MTPVELLLRDMDAQWNRPAPATKLRLNIIGCSALLLQTDYNRGTKDGDVLETADLEGDVSARLRALAGKNTALHARHRIYIEIVRSGLPFLPQAAKFHRVEALAGLRHFDAFVLDVVDVVVSKFKRYHANDQADVEAMIVADHVPHALLIERFRSAVDMFSMDARADELPRYVRNLHQAERDLFGVEETEIELPDWI